MQSAEDLNGSWTSLAVVAGCTALFMIGASIAYDPSRGFIARRVETTAAQCQDA
jgi:hypothetical protein